VRRYGVREDDFVERHLPQSLYGGAAQNSVRGTSEDPLGLLLSEGERSVHQSPCRVNHVVTDDHIPSPYLADHMHYLCFIGGHAACPFDPAAHIRSTELRPLSARLRPA